MDCAGHKSLPCTAPCSLYSVLFDNKVIDDPTLSDNALYISRYSEGGCEFYAEFEITPLIMSMKNVYLRFYGLDTLCRIELNGHEIATTDNMHITYSFDVKTKLCLGKNELRLRFSPASEGMGRKTYSSFGTEGSPRLPDMGIFRKIEIIAYNNKIISDIRVKQTHTDGTVRLDLSIKTEGYDELSRAVATLTSPAGNVYFCGFVGGEGNITITDPNLWWPSGVGMQNLYRLNVNLYSENEIEDTYEMYVGLRTVTLTEREGGGQDLFVNGIPVLAMGGEYMSEDILLSRLTPKRTRALLEHAKDANFNSIFIHGSGYYPERHFFDACDELGLMVWAELPDIKCGGDTENVKNSISSELSSNLTRMTRHPSVCVIVGNEELGKLFSVSELSMRFSDFEGMNVFDVQGDVKKNFVTVEHCSLPTYDSTLKFTEPENRNLGSEAFELHGADTDTVVPMLSKSYDSYPYANGMKELSYVTGLSSAETAMQDVDTARTAKSRPIAIFMKRMNDTWPSISPSAVDYYGGKKPLHYYERDFFSPVRITVTRNGTRVKFVVCNDMRQDYVGIFAYYIMNAKNQPVFRDSFPIRARAGGKLEVHSLDLGSVISGHEREYYLLYSVSDKSNSVSKGIHLFTKTKRFKLLKPNFAVDIKGNGTDYILTVGADCFVKGTEISFDGVDVSLDKNYFDITGKAPVRIRLTTPRMTTVEKLTRVMKLRSVYDLGHEE